ncbi:MAG: TIGR00180 family glycosyltransferase [Ferruginibacter sp.]
MEEKITLIIILHNRHINLDRLLDYYRDEKCNIIIADSSKEQHLFKTKLPLTVQYIYTPGLSYTQKVEHVLGEVTTAYTALCADDDFTVPGGLYACASFLESNHDYSAAQGTILRYYKDTIDGNIRIDLLYDGDHSLTSTDARERIQKLFHPYKSLLYALHRTAVLQDAFNNAGKAFRNLYLNEYLTSIVPVLKGKTKDLPVLFQVREHAETSDDKTAENLDIILKDKKYHEELVNFLDHIVEKGAGSVNIDKGQLKELVHKTLADYGRKIESFKTIPVGFKKKVGKFILKVPFLGKKYVDNRRYKESMASLEKKITGKDLEHIALISTLLKKYRNL